MTPPNLLRATLLALLAVGVVLDSCLDPPGLAAHARSTDSASVEAERSP